MRSAAKWPPSQPGSPSSRGLRTPLSLRRHRATGKQGFRMRNRAIVMIELTGGGCEDSCSSRRRRVSGGLRRGQGRPDSSRGRHRRRFRICTSRDTSRPVHCRTTACVDGAMDSTVNDRGAIGLKNSMSSGLDRVFLRYYLGRGTRCAGDRPGMCPIAPTSLTSFSTTGAGEHSWAAMGVLNFPAAVPVATAKTEFPIADGSSRCSLHRESGR